MLSNLDLGQKLCLGLSVLVILVCSAGGPWGFLLGVGLAVMGCARVWNNNKINPALRCPHCGMVGTVSTAKVDVNDGVSGGKATAGFLTGGLSLIVTGLSRHSRVTQATCGHCAMSWIIR